MHYNYKVGGVYYFTTTITREHIDFIILKIIETKVIALCTKGESNYIGSFLYNVPHDNFIQVSE